MSGAGFLLGLALATPAALLIACGWRTARARMPTLLPLAPLPALAAALLAHGGTLVLPQALLRVTLMLDTPGAIMLGVAAVIWSLAGVYAGDYLRGTATPGRFSAWWLLTLVGSLGVFMAADLVSFYLVFALVSLPAYGLVVYDGAPGSWRAGGVYIGMAILGEAFLLMAFVLLAAGAPGDSLLIQDAVAALSASPWRDAIVALLIAGFGVKIALVPLHFWMPLTYTAAPIPAAAALSGAAVKAGVIGLIRFLPLDTALPFAGGTLVALGLFGAFYAVAVGITQDNPKTVLAYSSISQMGVIATIFGMALTTADGSAAVLPITLYAAHHMLVKAALFLAVGVISATGPRRAWMLVIAPAAVLALSLGGVPFTGGALAKYVVKAPLGDGIIGTLAALSAAGTTLLMLHFLYCLAASAPTDERGAPPARLATSWLAMAVASVAIPWAVFVTLGGGATDTLTRAALIAALWPILLGAACFLALWPFRTRIPEVPPGDIIVLAPIAGRAADIAARSFERMDTQLRRWPVAGISLLAIAAVLTAMLIRTR
jgi:multicomponent Na+:H+ antiporter subunit A